MSFDDLYFHVILGCGNDAQFQDFCRLINQPQLAEIDEYKTNEDRVRNRTELISVSIDFLKFATNYIYRNSSRFGKKMYIFSFITFSDYH